MRIADFVRAGAGAMVCICVFLLGNRVSIFNDEQFTQVSASVRSGKVESSRGLYRGAGRNALAPKSSFMEIAQIYARQLGKLEWLAINDPELFLESIDSHGVNEADRLRLMSTAFSQIEEENPRRAFDLLLTIPRIDRVKIAPKVLQEWANTDPRAAFDAVFESGKALGSSLFVVSPLLWSIDSDHVIEQLKVATPDQREFIWSGIFDSPSTRLKRAELASIAALLESQFSAQNKRFIEARFLKKAMEVDLNFVERRLSEDGTVALRDQLAPQLALENADGNWNQAYEWLLEFEQQRFTPAIARFWNSWWDQDAPRFLEYIETVDFTTPTFTTKRLREFYLRQRK